MNREHKQNTNIILLLKVGILLLRNDFVHVPFVLWKIYKHISFIQPLVFFFKFENIFAADIQLYIILWFMLQRHVCHITYMNHEHKENTNIILLLKVGILQFRNDFVHVPFVLWKLYKQISFIQPLVFFFKFKNIFFAADIQLYIL
jgi:hypothetical protein